MALYADEETFKSAAWFLRLVLPCALFLVSFGPSLVRHFWPGRGRVSQGRCHSREALLQRRELALAGAGAAAPEALATLAMVTEETANAQWYPQRDKNGLTTAQRREQREQQRRSAAAAEDSARAVAEDVEITAAQEKMHLESLVNFVAFNPLHAKRSFLPAGGQAPPPPKPRPSLGQGAAGVVAAMRANAEAQMVLCGTQHVSSLGAVVARGLLDQLKELKVEISPCTFELMLEACIKADDIQVASDLLMHIESSGHVPSNELMDRVMGMYLTRKNNTKPEESQADVPPTPQTAAPTEAENPWMSPPETALAENPWLCETTEDMQTHVPQAEDLPVGLHQQQGAAAFADRPDMCEPTADAGITGALPGEGQQPASVQTLGLPAFSVPSEFAKQTEPPRVKTKLSADAPIFVPRQAGSASTQFATAAPNEGGPTFASSAQAAAPPAAGNPWPRAPVTAFAEDLFTRVTQPRVVAGAATTNGRPAKSPLFKRALEAAMRDDLMNNGSLSRGVAHLWLKEQPPAAAFVDEASHKPPPPQQARPAAQTPDAGWLDEGRPEMPDAPVPTGPTSRIWDEPIAGGSPWKHWPDAAQPDEGQPELPDAPVPTGPRTTAGGNPWEQRPDAAQLDEGQPELSEAPVPTGPRSRIWDETITGGNPWEQKPDAVQLNGDQPELPDAPVPKVPSSPPWDETPTDTDPWSWKDPWSDARPTAVRRPRPAREQG